jgi:hypothetical protein
MIPEGNPEEKGNRKASLCPKCETISLPPNGGLQGGQKDKPECELKEVAHSQSLHLTNLRKATRLRVLKLSQNKNILRQPPKGGLRGGQKDKPDQMFKEVAHSRSLHLTNLQEAMRLRGLMPSQKEHLRRAPARWEDHSWATVMRCMSEKQLGAVAICYVATCLQHHATTDVCFASPFKQFTQLVLIGAFDMFSLTAYRVCPH